MIPWNRKYRPSSVEHLVASDETKQWIESIVKSKSIPNMTLYSGQAGVGKTTIAKMIAKACCQDDEILFINGSLDRGIDTIRNEMLDFLTGATFTNNRKCIIIDEADSMNVLTLAAMRAFMEEWDQETSFILTCNDLSKFEDVKTKPILSRCPVRNLSIIPGRDKLGNMMYDRLTHILRMENKEFNKEDVLNVIRSSYPDMRTMISQIQSGSLGGEFKYSLIENHDNSNITVDDLVRALKSKDFISLRRWAKENYSTNDIFGIIYSEFEDRITIDRYEEFVKLLGKYTYEYGITASKEITFTSFLLEMGKLL